MLHTTARIARRGGMRLALLAVLCISCACSTDKPDPGRAAAGQKLFQSTCARCHGPEGNGGVPAQAGGVAPRNFHDEGFQDSRSDAALTEVIKGGKGGVMPAFAGVYDDDQIRSLIAFVRSCRPSAGAPR